MSLPVSDAAASPASAKDWGTGLDRILGLLAAFLLFVLMMLTAVDVVSRYIFNWPLRGAFELTELGLLVLIFAGLPLTSRKGEHVTLDFIDKALGERLANVWRRFVEVVVGFLFVGLTWQVWIKAGKISGAGDYTDVLKVPVGPFVYVMCGMIGITAIIHFIRAVLPSPQASHIPEIFDKSAQ
jgi:TRAP-type transport system small permease protein